MKGKNVNHTVCAIVKKKEASAQNPVQEKKLKVGTVKKVAGGIPAILSTFKHTRDEMGLLRGTETLLKVNQVKGFDCPGCAWPDPDDRRAMVEFCENGAKAVAEEATRKKIGPDFFKKHSIVDLSRGDDYWVGKQGRLTHPMVLLQDSDYYESISWDKAFTLIARAFNNLSSPDEAIFYSSGRTSNEAAFLYQLFVREFGTNNLPDCSDMCHQSSGVAMTKAWGFGKGTVTLEDFQKADLIVVLGQNPGTNHPRMLSSLQKAVQNGSKIISINPLPETGLSRFKHPQKVLSWFGKGTALASEFLQIKINGDVALLKGLAKGVLEHVKENNDRGLDRDFIDQYSDGFEVYRRNIETVSWDQIVSGSGVKKEKILKVAREILKSKAMICCWAMGLTQHKNAVGNIQEVLNLLMLGGHVGRPGAGACPVRGHSNVQGDRTMGINEDPAQSFLDRLEQNFGFRSPREPGYDTVAAIKAMAAGKAKVFFALGGNFLSATPDTEYTAQALSNCDLTVQVSTKLNRSHLITGKQALILPCLGRTEVDKQTSGEQYVTMENSMGFVHSSRGHLPPASEHLMSEVAIISQLAKKTLGDKSKTNWTGLASNYDEIRNWIERTIPGFDGYNKRTNGQGFYLPNPVRDERKFNTENGKAHFTVHPLPNNKIDNGKYWMMTIRTHDQFNTTIYGLDDRYRGICNGRRVLLMNEEDIQQEGLKKLQSVDIVSHFQGQKRKAESFKVVAYPIPRGCVATYFPEANVLVPIDSVAEQSNTPTSKFVLVSLEPSVVSHNTSLASN